MILMKKSINLHFYWFWLSCGWFPGDTFKAFCFTFGETIDDYHGKKLDQVTFLSIQIAYFTFAFGWQAE